MMFGVLERHEMLSDTLLTVLLTVWAAVTLAFLHMMAWKSLIGTRQEDVFVLHPSEAKEDADEPRVIACVRRLKYWAKTFGFSSLALLLVIGSIWAYQTYLVFNTGQMP
jgi:hypothetical protein